MKTAASNPIAKEASPWLWRTCSIGCPPSATCRFGPAAASAIAITFSVSCFGSFSVVRSNWTVA